MKFLFMVILAFIAHLKSILKCSNQFIDFTLKKARATRKEKKRLWKTFIIIKNNQIKELKLQNRQLDRILCDKIHDLNGYQQDLLSMQRAYDGIRKAFNEIESKHDRLQVENEKLKKENYDLKGGL